MALSSLDLNAEISIISQSYCALVFGFIRQNDITNAMNTPEGIIKICLLYAFKVAFKPSILSPDECAELHRMIGKQRNKYASEWKLLYKGSRDGYKVKNCHRRCYSRSNVVLIVESKKGNVFGGFTAVGWDMNAESTTFRSDPNAFLFLIRSKSHDHKHDIFAIKDDCHDEALFHFKPLADWGALFAFGRYGYDLRIVQECHLTSNSASCISYCFDSNNSYALDGEHDICVQDIELFQLL